MDALFGPRFLLERPLLDAVRAGDGAVLLVDEVDRADDEFEAFLLELLSDFQITIPEIGTIVAEQPPLVVLTSNRTRELHDALKRRCLYHWVGFPSPERELEIVLVRAPGVSRSLAEAAVAAVNRLREMDLAKPPGVAETIDWVRTLERGRGRGARRPRSRPTPSAPSSRTATTSSRCATTSAGHLRCLSRGASSSPIAGRRSPARCATPGSRSAPATC